MTKILGGGTDAEDNWNVCGDSEETWKMERLPTGNPQVMFTFKKINNILASPKAVLFCLSSLKSQVPMKVLKYHDDSSYAFNSLV